MNLADYIVAHAPVTNLPDLLNLHHNNPLHIQPIVQLVVILLLVVLLGVANFMVRYRDRQQFYPALYVLLALSMAGCYYYCFQNGLPEYALYGTDPRPVIGWFCIPVMAGGWFPAVIGMICITVVIFELLSACMQTAAQLSVDARLVKGKPWKEWKIAVYMLLLGVLLANVALMTQSYVTSSWILVMVEILIILFVLYKIVADSIRCHNVVWGLLIGLTFFVGINACMMLALECLRGTVFFIIVLAALLTQAKARKKKPQTQE